MIEGVAYAAWGEILEKSKIIMAGDGASRIDTLKKKQVKIEKWLVDG